MMGFMLLKKLQRAYSLYTHIEERPCARKQLSTSQEESSH